MGGSVSQTGAYPELRGRCLLTFSVRGPSKSDVYRRQILTSEDGPCTEKVIVLDAH